MTTGCGPNSESGPDPRWPQIRDVWDFNDPAASEIAFRDLAAEAGEAGDATFQAEALTQVARTFSLRRDFDQANQVLDEVEAGAGADNPRVRVRVLLERGRTLNSSGQAADALPMFADAFRLASRHNEHFLAGDAAHMAGIAEDLAGEEEWMRHMVNYLVDHPGTAAKYWLGPMHNNLGWTLFSDEQYDAAIRHFVVSGEAYETQPDKRMEVLIASYSVGRTQRAQGNCAEALPRQVATFNAIRSEFSMDDEYVAEEIALCRGALGDARGAREPAALALAKFMADQWVVDNEPERLDALRALAGE